MDEEGTEISPLFRSESGDENDEPHAKKAKLNQNSIAIVEKSEPEEVPESTESIPVSKKKKVALLVSYCGAGYYGMQKNPDVNTIEEELLKALCLAGGIKEDVRDDLAKLSFQRCARTDKGVSASRQVVSLKMVPDEEVLRRANEYLPPAIRVMGMKRVTRRFDCKLNCASRTYEYLLPTYAVSPSFHETRKDYRMNDSVLARVNEILTCYKGTHNYHNYTSGRLPSDASATRYIIDFTADKPFVKGAVEFVCLRVTGQSFMLHQIRKMIGLCIAISKGYCEIKKIDESWLPGKLDIPRAPGLGLALDRVNYTGYNKRYGSDGIHEPITWELQEAAVQSFKETYIWQEIINVETSSAPMMRWLSTLKCHSYTSDRTALPDSSNPKEITTVAAGATEPGTATIVTDSVEQHPEAPS